MFDAIRTKRKGIIKEAIHAIKTIRKGITNETTKKRKNKGKKQIRKKIHSERKGQNIKY